ncbi:MAG: type II secretion system protein [Planctomycetes bacterium]|nr:type II secretion system protein [Planctomycetota bacterium]
MPRPSNRRRNIGFTLIELIVVIFIIAILIVVLLVAILGVFRDSKLAATRQLQDLAKTALSSYYNDFKGYPGSQFEPNQEDHRDGSWVAANHALYLVLRDKLNEDDLKPFVKYWESGAISEEGNSDNAILVDGWGNPIIYWEWDSSRQGAIAEIPGEEAVKSRDFPGWAKDTEKGAFSIWSAGSDGVWGTEDDVDGEGNPNRNTPFKK